MDMQMWRNEAVGEAKHEANMQDRAMELINDYPHLNAKIHQQKETKARERPWMKSGEYNIITGGMRYNMKWNIMGQQLH